MIGIVGLVAAGMGLALIAVGVVLSIADWNRKRAPKGKPGEFVSEAVGLADVLNGLAKVFDALKNYGTGQFLMCFGLVLLIVGAVISGVGAITA